MKYSFMTFSTPEATFAEAIAIARRYGYDGIEPRITANQKHGIEPTTAPARLQEFRALAADQGVAVACIATSCCFASAAKAAATIGDATKAIEVAGRLGCARLRVFGGAIDEGMDRAAGIAQMIRNLGAMTQIAAEHEVVLCVETHDSWTNPEHLAAVMNGVNHPNVMINWDVMHPVRQSKWTVADSYRCLKPWIRHLHVHDGTLVEPLTLKAMGTGDIDHRAALKLLAADGYADYISGEWIGWEPYDVHLPRELATLKSYEPKTRRARP